MCEHSFCEISFHRLASNFKRNCKNWTPTNFLPSLQTSINELRVCSKTYQIALCEIVHSLCQVWSIKWRGPGTEMDYHAPVNFHNSLHC